MINSEQILSRMSADQNINYDTVLQKESRMRGCKMNRKAEKDAALASKCDWNQRHSRH